MHTTAVPTGKAAGAIHSQHTDYEEVNLNLFTGGVVAIQVNQNPALSLSLIVVRVMVVYSIVRFAWKLCKKYMKCANSGTANSDTPNQDPLKGMNATRDGKFLGGSMKVDYATNRAEADGGTPC